MIRDFFMKGLAQTGLLSLVTWSRKPFDDLAQASKNNVYKVQLNQGGAHQGAACYALPVDKNKIIKDWKPLPDYEI